MYAIIDSYMKNKTKTPENIVMPPEQNDAERKPAERARGDHEAILETKARNILPYFYECA